jgi:hypothetical protein
MILVFCLAASSVYVARMVIQTGRRLFVPANLETAHHDEISHQNIENL